jgi:hypothetical protein
MPGFKIEETSDNDDSSCQRPSTHTCVEVKSQIYQCIRDKRRIRTDGIQSEMNIVRGRKRCKNNLRLNEKIDRNKALKHTKK